MILAVHCGERGRQVREFDRLEVVDLNRQRGFGNAAPPWRSRLMVPSSNPACSPKNVAEDAPCLSLIDFMLSAMEIAPAMSAAPPFPIEALPPVMRAAVEALEQHVQAPRSLCAHSVLSAAMLVCQGLADIKVEGLPAPVPLSLFMLAIAVSGERKSACDTLALRAVADEEARLRLEHVEEDRRFKASWAAFEAEKKKIERDTKIDRAERESRLLALREPVSPVTPIIRAEEPNLEGLINLLRVGRASVGIFTSEAGQFLGGHGMGPEARTRTVTGLSKLWDNGSAQRVRAADAQTFVGRRVGISLAAQPRVASTFIGDELANDQGIVGRFLVMMPESTIGFRVFRATNPSADARLLKFQDQCRRCLDVGLPIREGARNELAPPVLDLSPDAWTLFRQFGQSIEDENGPGKAWRPVSSAAGKIAENVARIAGILTLFEQPETARPSRMTGISRSLEIKVSVETMAAACAIGTFYLREALRLTGHAILDPEIRAQNDLVDWLVEKVKPGNLTAPSLIQKLTHSHLRTDAATLRRRLDALVSFGRIEPAGKQEIDGKTYRETYRVMGEA
ncbi:DUF3987 domain-containing protein [Methylobacterium sp. J-026]|uniref:YfjI family protein n=1 Tax=Methylobacterium sp. J-026 TaxID=2836624 RepID=UPI001FBA4E39|nr:YfjI family protein [Methylobacterium sp. J-026]MCJ2136644.1 DUF3987 domain-containing protein [Methylobacterium sp. J-026]